MTWHKLQSNEYELLYNSPNVDSAWGAYIIDKRAERRLILQCPHPVADAHTHNIAIKIWVKTFGTFLMMAGAHRKAGGPGGGQGLADVPWNENSMFNQIYKRIEKAPTLQIHGFADANQPNYEIVLATGSAPTNQFAINLYDAIKNEFNVARFWAGESSIYGAIGNEQSKIARDNEIPFVHLEMNRSLRNDENRTQKLASIIADVVQVSASSQ